MQNKYSTIPYPWLEAAYERILPHIQRTPLTYDHQNGLYLKWENHQVTGSFKVRGAINKILSLQTWEHQRGLVTASAGNHGQGVALAGKLTGSTVLVFASEHASPAKILSMRSLGAEVRLVLGGYGEAERAGLVYSSSTGAIWISPYNDGQVIAGQATLAIEMLEQLPSLSQSTWIVPAGGGGLVSGIGAVLEKIHPRPRLVAVQSSASSFLHSFYHHGTQQGIVELPSLADGLAGPVEDGSVTIPLVKKYVDDFILVSEESIAKAISHAWRYYHECIEGSAAVALAAVLDGKVTDRPAVILMTGGNIQPELHQQIINGFNDQQ
jgi:threonine dehydratase